MRFSSLIYLRIIFSKQTFFSVVTYNNFYNVTKFEQYLVYAVDCQQFLQKKTAVKTFLLATFIMIMHTTVCSRATFTLHLFVKLTERKRNNKETRKIEMERQAVQIIVNNTTLTYVTNLNKRIVNRLTYHYAMLIALSTKVF